MWRRSEEVELTAFTSSLFMAQSLFYPVEKILHFVLLLFFFSTISTLNPICHRWDFSLELSPPPPPAASAFLSSAVAAVTAHVRARLCA